MLIGLLALALGVFVALFLVRGGSKLGSTEPSLARASDPARADPARIVDATPAADERAPVAARVGELPVRVEDRASGQPLAGVPLELQSAKAERLRSAISRDDGRCRFVALEPGDCTLKAAAVADVEYAADPVPVAITGEVHEELVLRVERRWFIAGVVVEKGSDRPVAGVNLSAREPSGNLKDAGTSAEDGRFRSPKSFAAGRLALALSEADTEGLVRTHGPGPDLLDLDVGQGDVTHLRVEFDWVGALKVLVLDARDQPIAGAELRVLSGDSIYLENANLRYWGLYEQMRGEGRVGRSDAQGRFAFGRLPCDRALVVLASAAGCASGRSADLSPPLRASDEPVVIHLASGGSIAGTVRDAQGAALAEARITALSADAEFQPDPTRTDVQGAYRLSGLKPGPTEVTALVQQHGEVPHAVAGAKVDVIVGQEVRLDLRVGADGVHLSGIAIDQDGKVLTGDRMYLKLRTAPLEPRPGDSAWGFDTPLRDDGSFDVTVPREGGYRLALHGSMAGDPWKTQDIQAPARDLRLEFPVAPTGTLEIRALDAASGEPIGRGDVLIAWEQGSMSQNFFGGGLSWPVREGAYTLVVDAKGFAPASKEVDLRGKMQERTLVEVRLDRGRSISGIVRDAAGQPIKGCTIVLQVAGHLQLQNLVYSGADGRFSIASAPTNGGSVCVIDEAYRTLASAEIGPGDVALTIGAK